MDQSLRHHQAGVFAPASNNNINFYSTQYATEFNHQTQSQPQDGPDEALACPSGFNQSMKQTGLDKMRQLGQDKMRQLGQDTGHIVSTYKEYYEKPDSKTLRETTWSLSNQDIHTRRKANGEMIQRTGFARNNEYKGKDAVSADTSTYADSYTQRPNMHAAYRERSSVLQHPKASNGFTSNQRADPPQQLHPDEVDEWMQTTYNENNKRSISRGRRRVPPPPQQRQRGELSGYTRAVQENTALLGRGYSERDDSDQNFAQVARELERLKREDPLRYQYVLGGTVRYQSTYTTSHNDAAALEAGRRDASLDAMKTARAGVGGRAVASGDYGNGDGYTGMYVPQTKRDAEWLSRTLPVPGTQAPHVGLSQGGSGFTQNFKPFTSAGPATAMMYGSKIGTETTDSILSSQVYGSGKHSRMAKAEEIMKGNRGGAYRREHVPAPLEPAPKLLHPTVHTIQRLKQVQHKNIGEGVFRPRPVAS